MVGCAFGLAATTRAGDTVPVHGSLRGTVTITPVSEIPPVVDIRGDATGPISHMGLASATVTFPNVEVDILSGQLILSETQWFVTVTAANGDQIQALYTLPVATVAPDPEGNIDYVAELLVLGGTGRFEGATGSGLSFGRANVFTFAFTTDVVGQLSSVGSAKKK
jgi:hypothetical protein